MLLLPACFSYALLSPNCNPIFFPCLTGNSSGRMSLCPWHSGELLPLHACCIETQLKGKGAFKVEISSWPLPMASSTSVISATGEFLRHSSDTGGCLPIIIISLLCFHAARSCSSHRCCKSLPAGSSDYPSSLFSLPLPAEPS